MDLHALKSRDFRNYLISFHLSLNGFWAQRVILGWLAWDQTGSAGFVGLVAFLNFFPTIFVSPLFGVIADKIDVRKGSIISYSMAGTISALFAFMSFMNLSTPVLLAGFSLLTGLISSANHPMRMSLTPRLAPAAQLSSVVALTSLNFNLSRLIGPAIGGLLIQTIGAPLALMVTAWTYAAPVLALIFIRPRQRHETTIDNPTGYFASLRQGWNFAISSEILRTALIFSAVGMLAGRSVLETLPIIANGVFERGPSGLGFMTAAAGAGATCAAILKAFTAAQQPDRFPRHVLFLVMMIPCLVASLSPATNFYVAILIVTALGGSTTLLGISLQTLAQMTINDDFRGRVMGLWTTISIGSGAMGAMLMGIAIEGVGISTAQFSIGALFAVAGLVAIFRRKTA